MDSLIDIHKPITVCKASAGTGKTYTLAAYYVGLILSGEDYRSILAITFTNKATAEMSERIIGYLYSISQGEEQAFLARARQFMLRDADAPDTFLQRRAGEAFQRMLLDYDNVQVMTIDSFLQSLLGGLAGVLRMSAGLTTELDVEHVIQQAVDQLLTTDMSAEDRSIIEDYMQLKLDQESQWDVRNSLCAMAKELYNESVQILDAEGRICFDSAAIIRRREALEEAWKQDADRRQLGEMLKQCHPESYNRNTRAGYDRLVRSLEEPQKMKADDRFRGVTLKSSNSEEMNAATELAAKVGRRYNTIQLTIRFSRDMQLMGSLQALIQSRLAETNSALLARTAGTLTKALKAGDADFILEKAGIRYHHVLIDEFQDTSQLQWSVIRQLLLDVLASEGNTLLIVGDIKQSIYRWRNGNWHIMDQLAEETIAAQGERINPRFTSLTKNFRSSEEVVRFNLSLFKHIIAHQGAAERIYGEQFEPDQLAQFYQAKKKDGGYVHFAAVPNAKKEDLALKMLDEIEDLLSRGVQPSDIMILVRERKEAALITSMTSLPIVSADSFILEASEDVRLIIAGLKYLFLGDEVSAKYIEIVTSSPDFIGKIRDRISVQTPLFEAMSELIAILLTDAEGQYHGTETAYINNLLDRTRNYVSSYGSNVAEFLTYWDDTMHEKAIPASSGNAIRIMTVHASKGLQAQTLFVPFCMWPMEVGHHAPKVWCEVAPELGQGTDFIPIQDGTEMANSAYDYACEEEHANMRVDNLNMLYVALTRAEDNLYVYTAYSVNKDGKRGVCKHVGKYLMDFVGEDEYIAGEPVVKAPKKSTETSAALRAELWANSDQVRFVQSQEGAMYTDHGDEAYRRIARMDEGNLCHEIFANLRKADELEDVLDCFESRGEIRDKAQRESLKSLISSAWQGSEEMHDWFTAPWQLKLEEAIYIDEHELRPDRVMINPQTNEAIVLDYKFGIWEDKYIQQVRAYMEALRHLGYGPVQGYLWFAQQNKLVKVNG